MQRKPGFLHASSCNIKMPDGVSSQADATIHEEDWDQKRRVQLINFGHAQWGFECWSWAVTKQDLDFVDFSNGKYSAGVVAFVSVTVKSLNIHRENIGYATTTAPMKGSAIYQARKGAVTNALRETLLSFGDTVTTDLLELLEAQKTTEPTPAVPPAPPIHTAPPASHPPETNQENNQNIPNKPTESKNANKNGTFHPPRKDSVDSTANPNLRTPHQPMKPVLKNPVVQNPPPPVAKALPMPANLPPVNKPNPGFPPANQPRPPPPPHPRPNSNVSFVLQPVMGGVVPPMYGPPPPRMPHVPPHLYPNYYAEYTAGPWHFTYEGYDRHHGNVNLNFNIPPKNLVVNSRSGAECRNACGVRPGAEGEPVQYAGAPQNQGCWIKPTIFYDGFWTEQKVKKWVAEQVEKQFPEDASNKSSPSQLEANPKL